MPPVVGTIRMSVWEYWQNYRVFVIASCVVSIPISVLVVVYGAVSANDVSSPEAGTRQTLDSLTSIALLSSQMLTQVAVTLLAADGQTFGRWGWREAWARTLRRTRQLLTGNLALLLPLAPIVVVALGVVAMFPGLIAAWFVLPLLIAPLGAMVNSAIALEGRGGFAAVWRGWSLLRADFWRSATTLWIVSAPTCFLTPVLGALLPWHPMAASMMASVAASLLLPVTAFATIAIYRESRVRLEEYSDERLRTELDAI